MTRNHSNDKDNNTYKPNENKGLNGSFDTELEKKLEGKSNYLKEVVRRVNK